MQNHVPNSDTGISSSQITWPRTLKMSDLIRIWRHHRQRNEHIQGSIDAKVTKRYLFWTNTRSYRAIKCENTSQIWWWLLCAVPNMAGKFVFSNNWCKLPRCFCKSQTV